MEYKDYYKILGITKNASKDEIQRAYRKLARKYHPDVCKVADAKTKFIEINEAYEVLKDPEKKEQYDTLGRSWSGKQQTQSPPGRGGEKFAHTYDFGTGRNFNLKTDGFSDFFQSLFGSREGRTRGSEWSSFDFGAGSQARASEAELAVTLDEVFYGATKTIILQSWAAGKDGEMQPQQRTLQVKIPRGISNGSVIRLAGQGVSSITGAASADLLCSIRIMPNPLFRVAGHDLHTTVALTPWEAALGCKIEVKTVDGKVSLKIPDGTRNGRRFRLRGKGIPLQTGGAGDLIVMAEIQVPHPLSEEEKKLFTMLAEKSKFKPRAKGGQKASDSEEI